MERFFNLMCTQILTPVFCSSLILFRNVALSYKIHGIGTTDTPRPPIVLIHNIVGNKKVWDAIGKTILRVTRRSVVAIDLRNHGESPHVKSHTYIHQASDVLELIEQLGTNRASLIGHGFGGKTAMCVALMEPRKVAGVLVVDISPVSSSPRHNKYIMEVMKAMKAVDFKNPKMVSTARATARTQLMKTVQDKFLMDAIVSGIRVKKNETIGWACNLHVLMNQYKHWVSFPKELKRKTYPGPTMFIGGQLSDLIPSEDLTEIRVLFPHAVLVYVPNAGHYVHFEDTKKFLELTIPFLKTHSCFKP